MLYIPEGSAFFWNSLLAVASVAVLAFMLLNRRAAPLTAREQALSRVLGPLSAARVRRLAMHAEWKVAGNGCVLTIEGEPVSSLYYVFSGTVEILKRGQRRTREGNMFIGEVAFLARRRASATVRIEKGASYVEWSSNTLRRLISGGRGAEDRHVVRPEFWI